MTRWRRRRLAGEVVDALRDDPDLLWVARQVAALAGEPEKAAGPRRRGLVIVGAAVAVAAGMVVALTGLPLVRDHAPRLGDEALAAVGSNRVLHAVVARAIADDRTVDLSTGTDRPSLLTVESWFDEQSGRLRVVERRNHGVVRETVGTARRGTSAPAPRLGPLPVFLTGYRQALRQGRVRDLGTAVVAGREVRWLALIEAHHRGERVAVDPDTFVPLVVQEPDGTRWSVARVVSVPFAAADFRPKRKPPPVPTSGGIVGHRPTSPSQATKLLGLPVLGIARSRSHLRLEGLEVDSLVSAYPRSANRPPLHSPGVSVTYLLPDGAIVSVRQARRPLPAYAFSGDLTFGFDPVPRPGAMQLTTTGGAWLGQLRSRRLYVTITGPDPRTVVDAARQLRPITE